jgi:hypothetical protein
LAPLQWEHHRPQKEYQFPPRDLAISLISLYFSHVNTFSPLLHRPTFETAFAINTQFSDDGYAATLLLVCAIGAHFSDDPRLHLPAMPFRTAGWKWFDQVKLGHCRQPTLYDLQSYCVCVRRPLPPLSITTLFIAARGQIPRVYI